MEEENTAQSHATGPGTAPEAFAQANPQPGPRKAQEGASQAGDVDELPPFALRDPQPPQWRRSKMETLLDALDMIARGLDTVLTSEWTREAVDATGPRAQFLSRVGTAVAGLQDLSGAARKEFAGASFLMARDELLWLLGDDAHLRRQRDELQRYAARLLEERTRPAEEEVIKLRHQLGEAKQRCYVLACKVEDWDRRHLAQDQGDARHVAELEAQLKIARAEAAQFLDDARVAVHQRNEARKESDARLQQSIASEKRAQALLADLMERTAERDKAVAKCQELTNASVELVKEPPAPSPDRWGIEVVMGSGYRDGSWAVRVSPLPLPAPGRYLLETPGGECIPVKVWAMPSAAGVSRYVCLSAAPKRVMPEPGWTLVVDLNPPAPPPAPPPAEDDARAKGMQRAAALGGPLSGPKLMALLRADQWAQLEELGREVRELHDLPRGRRRQDDRASPTLQKLDALATDLLKSAPPLPLASDPPRDGGNTMSYDPEGKAPAQSSTKRHLRSVASGRDLEAIVTLLELAALTLTPSLGATFTRSELFREAREIGGDEIELEESDLKNVLGKAGFLKNVGDGKFCLK